MSYELKIALRFLIKSRTQTIFILFGIALGVAVQIFLGNLITSLQDSLVENTIGNSPHIVIASEEDTITKLIDASSGSLLRGNYPSLVKNLENWRQIDEDLSKDSRVTAISPTQDGTAIIRSSGKSLPIAVKGIDLARGDAIYDINSRITSGNASLEGSGILIGLSLAEQLGKATGDSISLVLPGGSQVQLYISGILDLENESANSSLVFMDLSRAQKLFGSASSVSSLEIQIADPFEADSVSAEWTSIYQSVDIDNWKARNSQLLSALTSQSSSSYTIQFFVIIAVTFGIASVLAVSAVQKARQIGILKAMGATSRSIARIFIYEGFLLGLAGSILGSLFGIMMLTVFGKTALSFELRADPAGILLIMFLAVAAGTISSLIPARNSALLNPMEAIRNG